MNLDTLVRAAQILRAQPACTMPLARLHACLTEEIGSDAGTYAHVHAELKKRPQSFMVLEPPKLIEDDSYESALERAGLGACTWIALVEAPSDEEEDMLGLAGATLSELWAQTDSDPALREYLVHAARQLEAVGQVLGR
jgi:hypothetical protein